MDKTLTKIAADTMAANTDTVAAIQEIRIYIRDFHISFSIAISSGVIIDYTSYPLSVLYSEVQAKPYESSLEQQANRNFIMISSLP